MGLIMRFYDPQIGALRYARPAHVSPPRHPTRPSPPLQHSPHCQPRPAHAGTVLLDGVDLRQYNVRWLRGLMAVVQQEPVLFGASIRGEWRS